MAKTSTNSLLHIANAYIILSILYYWIETSVLLNPVAIGLALVFGIHLFVAKGVAKMVFPVIFIILNLFMFLALFSELSEFSSWNNDAIVLLVVGCLYLGLNILCGSVIIKKNVELSIV